MKASTHLQICRITTRSRLTMAKLATTWSLNHLPVAMRVMHPNPTRPQANICRDECRVTTRAMILNCSIPLESAMYERLMRMRNTLHRPVGMQVVWDSRATMRHRQNMKLVKSTKIRMQQTQCTCLLRGPRRSQTPCPDNSTGPRPRANPPTTPNNTASRSRKHNRT